ncbi:Gamma-glutamyl phosphate reductase [Labeo rohita]|uniref:Gamma-glutamyl phosphate reductase n=1 Tax=Labeo rohita TaxID=84645 RepID=A0ABQ8LAB1_LABRO|nr:Gamma-glutamyl phosphate reductase [Labeo rohita]
MPSAESSATGPGTDAELFRILSKDVEELDLEWSPPEKPTRGCLDEWFLPGRHQAPHQRASPFFPEVHDEITKSWHAPYSANLCTSSSSALSSIDGAEEKGYDKPPPLDESVAAHLCPPTGIRWKAKATHPSKPCRTTSALTGRAYSSTGQVYQAKLLRGMDESGPHLTAFKDLHSTTDLALCTTKMTAQVIGRSITSLVVLECHLQRSRMWIKSPLLNNPSPCFTGRGLASHPWGVKLGQRRSEVRNLLATKAKETVPPPAQSESGFYSRYFLVPKKDGGLRSILDLRRLNRAHMRRPFRMLTLKQILLQV